MTNSESAQDLLNGAERIFREVRTEFNAGSYNLAIRRAQETVELALKAALKLFGVDFPKEYNVGALFVKFVKEKQIETSDETLNHILSASSSLAKDRLPAFYWERRYTKVEARVARDEAAFVLKQVRSYFRRHVKSKKKNR